MFGEGVGGAGVPVHPRRLALALTLPNGAADRQLGCDPVGAAFFDIHVIPVRAEVVARVKYRSAEGCGAKVVQNHALEFDRVNLGMRRLVYVAVPDSADVEPEAMDDRRPTDRQIVFSVRAVVEIDVLRPDSGVEIIVGHAARAKNRRRIFSLADPAENIVRRHRCCEGEHGTRGDHFGGGGLREVELRHRRGVRRCGPRRRAAEPEQGHRRRRQDLPHNVSSLQSAGATHRAALIAST